MSRAPSGTQETDQKPKQDAPTHTHRVYKAGAQQQKLWCAHSQKEEAHRNGEVCVAYIN